MRKHFLIERAPVGANAHGLVMFDRQFDNGAELLVLLFLETDISGIDAIFGEGFRASGMIGEQFVADIMKIANQRRQNPQGVELFTDFWHGRRGLVAVHGDPHQFRAGLRQSRDLPHCKVNIRRVRIGHALHDHRRAAADDHSPATGADTHANALASLARNRRDFCFAHGREIMFGHREEPVFQQNELLYQRNAPTRIRRRAPAPNASLAGL